LTIETTSSIAHNSQLDHSALNPVKPKYKMSLDSVEKNNVSLKEHKSDHHVLPPEVEEIARISSKLENPLAGLTTQELIDEAEEFCLKHSLLEHGESLF
jgi:hypothetical protein